MNTMTAQEEYAALCAQAGDAGYKAAVLKAQVQQCHLRMDALNQAAQKEAEVRAKLAAETPKPEAAVETA